LQPSIESTLVFRSEMFNFCEGFALGHGTATALCNT
jgi:hypothetical protein